MSGRFEPKGVVHERQLPAKTDLSNRFMRAIGERLHYAAKLHQFLYGEWNSRSTDRERGKGDYPNGERSRLITLREAKAVPRKH